MSARWTIQVMCMLCPRRLSESDDDDKAAVARLDARAAAAGWRRVGDSDVCPECGADAARTFRPTKDTFSTVHDDEEDWRLP